VYSGGGVEPDRRFDGPVDGFNPSRFSRTIYARNLFDSFAQRFTRQGDTRIAPSTTTRPRELTEDFEVTDALVAEFKEHVRSSGLRMDDAAWQQDLEFIKAMIRFEIDVDLFGVETSRRNLATRDPQLQYALTLFPEAERLLEMGAAAPGRVAGGFRTRPRTGSARPARGGGTTPAFGFPAQNIVVSVGPCHNGWALLHCTHPDNHATGTS
jgi:hypothetical protein